MDNILTFTIDTKEPIPLDLFNKSLASFKKEFDSITQTSSELYIKEIRKGSIEIDLLAVAGIAAAILPLIDGVNSIAQFMEYVKRTAGWLSGESQKPKEIKYTMNEFKNFRDIFAPVIQAKDENANIQFISEGIEPIHLDKVKIIKIIKHQEITLELQEQNNTVDTSTNVRKKVLFYWNQTGFDDKNLNTGNRGMIDSIDTKPHKVIFSDDDSTTKKEMTRTNPDTGVEWQNVGYIVDVEVMKKGSEIVAYKIIDNYMQDAIY
jgi:hypothetical protein